jgi:hypothetical protein
MLTCTPCHNLSQRSMLQAKYLKLTLSTQEARDAIPVEVWTGVIAETLTDVEIAGIRMVSKRLCSTMSDDEMWLGKLTLLSLQHPGVSDLAKGEQETVYAWYTRCHAAARDGEDLEGQRGGRLCQLAVGAAASYAGEVGAERGGAGPHMYRAVHRCAHSIKCIICAALDPRYKKIKQNSGKRL